MKPPPLVREGAYMDPRWRETMAKLIKQRIIELRTGDVPYIHQAFFVNQKAGWRFVVNFKPGVNKHTVPESGHSQGALFQGSLSWDPWLRAPWECH